MYYTTPKEYLETRERKQSPQIESITREIETQLMAGPSSTNNYVKINMNFIFAPPHIDVQKKIIKNYKNAGWVEVVFECTDNPNDKNFAVKLFLI